MKIFITGVAGFLGSHLAERMLNIGHDVLGNDNLIGGDLENVNKKGWKIVYQKDMTLNALPTLKFAITFINRFLNPLALFIGQKIKYKQGWLFYLTKELRINLNKKSNSS